MKHSYDLADLMLQLYKAISRGDFFFIDELISQNPGTLWIGSDPEEWWDDRNRLMRAWQNQVEELGGPMNIRSEGLHAYENGDIGWVADQAVAQLQDGTEISFRFTAVFEREDERWKIVQAHNSVGIPNEDLVGAKLTV